MPEPGPPEPPPPVAATPATTGLAWDRGTLPRALLVLCVIGAILGVAAWLFTPAIAPSPLERYLRLGGEAGAAALGQDLSAQFPEGSPTQPLQERLERLGFRCVAPQPGRMDCDARLRRDATRMTAVRVVTEVRQGRVVRITPSLTTVTP